MSLQNVTDKIRIEMSGSTQRYMVSAKQGDKATRYIEVTLLDSGEEYQIPVGAVVTSYVRKPDRKRVYATCQYSGAKVTVALNSQTLAVAGTALCEVEVKSVDLTQVITSVTFEIEIEPRVKDEDAIISSDEMTILDDMMNKYAEAEKNRVQGEQNRVNAENGRVEDERKRKDDFENIKRNVKDAIDNVKETTENIQKKADNGDFTGTIKIGTITTGEAGSKACVTNSGTSKDAVLDMVIPKGDKGDKGDKGNTGDKGETGATGTRGSRWYAGTAMNGTSTSNTAFTGSGITDALVNDMYLNTSTGGTYRCTVAGNAANARWEL